MNNDINLKLIQLNNKSRKGFYFYVKKKGLKGAYYKLDKTFPKEKIIEYYKNRYELKNIKKNSLDLNFNRYKSRIKLNLSHKEFKKEYLNKFSATSIKLNNIFKSGKTELKIKNILKLSNNQINKAYVDLIRPLINKKTILEKLARENNMKKIKTSFHFIITAYDENDEKLGSWESIGKKTLREVVNEMKVHAFRRIELKDFSEGVRIKLKNLGYVNYEHFENGAISYLKTKIKFRK